jgi:hypothetical protein
VEGTLRPYKFAVQAIIQRVVDDRVTEELSSEPVVVFGIEGLEEYTENFEENLNNARFVAPNQNGVAN